MQQSKTTNWLNAKIQLAYRIMLIMFSVITNGYHVTVFCRHLDEWWESDWQTRKTADGRIQTDTEDQEWEEKVIINASPLSTWKWWSAQCTEGRNCSLMNTCTTPSPPVDRSGPVHLLDLQLSCKMKEPW